MILRLLVGSQELARSLLDIDSSTIYRFVLFSMRQERLLHPPSGGSGVALRPRLFFALNSVAGR